MKAFLAILVTIFAAQTHADPCHGSKDIESNYSFTMKAKSNSLDMDELKLIVSSLNKRFLNLGQAERLVQSNNDPNVFLVYLSNGWDGTRLSATNGLHISVRNKLTSLFQRGLIESFNENPNIAETAKTSITVCY